MYDKSKTKVANSQQLIHRLPAGMMQGDNATELFADRNTKKVYAISNGQTIPFSDLPGKMRAQVFAKMLADGKALIDLKNMEAKEALDRFAFCIYGAADSNPDFCSNGILKEADNFICGQFCQCLKWNSKKITIKGQKLTSREIEIIQLLATDLSDKMIADQLNISVSTLYTHKKHLFEKAEVFSKNGLIMAAAAEKIIQ
jgi:DNA-binding CsgD family transcriptional regulator